MPRELDEKQVLEIARSMAREHRLGPDSYNAEVRSESGRWVVTFHRSARALEGYGQAFAVMIDKRTREALLLDRPL
jgi:hypothetical protein